MSLLGGVRSGLGGTKTTGESSGGGGGTITQITSPGNSITVGNPTGPHVTVDVNAAAFPAVLFDMFLSYGHGMDVDENLPPATSFWLSPTTIADLARADQVREWEVDHALSSLRLVVVVSESANVGAGLPVIVTVDGVDTALSVLLPDGVSGDTSFEAFLILDVPSGSFMGVRVDGSAVGASASVRMQARLIGLGDGGGGAGIPFVTTDFTLQGDGTALNPLGTKIRTLAGTDGVQTTSDGSGNYHFRGSVLSAFESGMIYADIPNVGRQFDTTRLLVGTQSINALSLGASQPFAWELLSDNYKTWGEDVLISAAWCEIRNFVAGPATIAPEISLLVDGVTLVATPFGPSLSDLNNNASLGTGGFRWIIPIAAFFHRMFTIQGLVNGIAGGPGLTAKIDRAAAGPTQLDISIILALDQTFALNP